MRRQLDAGVAAGDRGGGCEIAARAVAGDADARGIAAEFGDARDDVLHGGEGILEGAGKAHLGRAAIIDGHHDGAGLDGEQARLAVMGVEIARNPAAAVEEQHRRRCAVGVPIDARREETGRTFHLGVFRAHDRRWRHGRARRGQRTERIARTLRRHVVGIAQRQQRNDLGDDGIERRGHAFPLIDNDFLEQTRGAPRWNGLGSTMACYTTGTRRAATAAGEITSMSSGTRHRSVSRTRGASLPISAPSITKPSKPLLMTSLHF